MAHTSETIKRARPNRLPVKTLTPAVMVDLGRAVHCYTWAERHEILKAAFQIRLDESGDFAFANFLGLMMLAGMRIEEVLLMRWEAPDVQRDQWPWPDMKAWQIVIPDRDAGVKGRRVAPIVPQLARLLTYWPAAKHGHLFPFKVTQRQIVECWKETVKLANVKPVSIHSLRDTYAAMMSDVFGLSPLEIRRILGTSH